MTPRSIRFRLTAFYTGVVVLATLALAAGSYWILLRGIRRGADSDLAARIDGVRRFIEHTEDEEPPAALQDEFVEYAELTDAEALIEVRDAMGASLVKPSFSGWESLAAESRFPVSGETRFAETSVRGAPFRTAKADITVRGKAFHVIVALPMAAAYATLARVRLLFVLLLPGFVLLAAASSYWLIGRALEPVARMARAARAITVKSLDRRLELPEADDELRALGQTFNEMLGRLEGSVAEIVRFTTDASHELRSPVARVRTTAELALRRERTGEGYRQALAEVLREAEHMSRLVQGLLTLAREDAGIEERDRTHFDLVEVAAAALRTLREAATLRRIELDLEAPREPIEIDGDPSLVRRVLVALLENAVTYTPSGGEIEVRVFEDPSGSAVVEVRDTGPGVDPVDLPRVFERFYRGAAAREQAPEGSGLGLAIAKAIVGRQGGKLHLENVPGPAPGCRVRVELPLVAKRTSREDPWTPVSSETPGAGGSR